MDDYPSGRQVPRLVVYRYDSPLFFANAEHFARALAASTRPRTPVHWFLLNAEANIEVDLTAADALDELRRNVAERSIVFAVARVKKEVRDLLISVGFVEKVGSQRTSMTLPTAVDGLPVPIRRPPRVDATGRICPRRRDQVTADTNPPLLPG